MTALDALARARAAWEATQPQLVLNLDPDALSQADVAASPLGFPRVGLTEDVGSEGPANRRGSSVGIALTAASARPDAQPAPGSRVPNALT